MTDIRERIVGAVLVVVGIAAMVLAFGGGAAHAAPGIDQAVTGAMVQEEASSDASSDTGSQSSDSSDTAASDSSDSSDASDTSDTTDEESDSPTPAPLPTETPTTEDTPTELPTDDASETAGRTSPLGWILLGGGVLMAGAAFAVYRRGA
ncbi:MAG TPA: hypothetical protein VM093_04905 [Aeromicrobium sp.]|nr:hypothetical protein [Aeromicrobium sp.]